MDNNKPDNPKVDNGEGQQLSDSEKPDSAPKSGDNPKKTYQTYTKKNPETGEIYCGRTSGCGTPEENISKRDQNHHKDKDGFGPAKLDRSSENKDAIRGREQQQIDENGGAKSQGGTSGNAINGVSDKNPKKQQYDEAAKKEFGCPDKDKC